MNTPKWNAQRPTSPDFARIGTPAVPGPDAGWEASDHEHTWALMRFELVDDRPVVRQTCVSCGFVRAYRAWERYWNPGEGEIRR